MHEACVFSHGEPYPAATGLPRLTVCGRDRRAPCWSVRSARHPAWPGASYGARALPLSWCLPVAGRPELPRRQQATNRRAGRHACQRQRASGRPGPVAWQHPVACCAGGVWRAGRAAGTRAAPSLPSGPATGSLTRFLWTSVWMTCAKPVGRRGNTVDCRMASPAWHPRYLWERHSSPVHKRKVNIVHMICRNDQ
jgi:hypothetical protein